MAVVDQLSASKSPLAATSTPSTGMPGSASRKTSSRTQQATAVSSRWAAVPPPSTAIPPSVHGCGIVYAGVRSPAVEQAATRTSTCSSAIDGLRAVGVLADLASEVEAFERELDRSGARTVRGRVEPVAHVVVELGLTQHRQPGEEVTGGDLLAGGDHRTGLDRVDQQAEVEASEVVADGLGGGGAEQVGEHLGL